MIYFFILFRFLAERIIFPYFDTVILFLLLRTRESGRFAILAFTFFSPREGGKEGVTTMLEVKQIVRRKFRNHP